MLLGQGHDFFMHPVEFLLVPASMYLPAFLPQFPLLGLLLDMLVPLFVLFFTFTAHFSEGFVKPIPGFFPIAIFR